MNSNIKISLIFIVTASFSFAQEESLKNADHWSFQPLAEIVVPAKGNAIDGFIRAKLVEKKLSPNPEADRRTLIRRLTFDLHGLPPTLAEIEAFIADPAGNDAAVAAVIERLLASPRYGERWARHWLDVARFSESQGFERDRFRPNSWRYRDYVIESFNVDKPYDQFAREQVAGDVMEPATQSGTVATGFLVAGPWDEVGSNQQSKVMKSRVREEDLEDVVSAVGQTFLGVTINCARCHDHKFDPIPAKDYYAFKAVFEGVWHGERSVLTPAELAERKPEIDQLVAELTRLGKQIKVKATTELKMKRKRTSEKLKVLFPKVYAASPRKPVTTYFLERGDVNLKKGVIVAAGLSGLKSISSDLGLSVDSPEAERRRAFAIWMTSPQNPLFARAIVNRVWHYHFGIGLVDTPNDLGVGGGKPSHPKLLDWLAAEFIRQNWSLKKLHTLILTSQTWRQSSNSNSRAVQLDADNRLLWRYTPKRLESEAVRDAMLAISGELNLKAGGPSVRPYHLVIRNSHFYHFKDEGEAEFNRRTIYRAQIASLRDSLLEALDCPSIGIKTPDRGNTATPMQALSLMNNSFVERQCRKLVSRVEKLHPDDHKAQIEQVFQLVFGRMPTDVEVEKTDTVRREHSLREICWALLNSTEFIFVK